LKQYYCVPFNANALIEKKQHSLCEIRESVQMNVNMIIKTHFCEYRFNHNYGCFIWNQDYSTVANISEWLDELQNSILSSIELNEPRISKIEIKIDLEEAEFFERFKGQPLRLKHKLTIEVKGVVTYLNELFEHYEFLFFSPLSVA
jgi:predicted component of type VI protein secretion system